jgi:hypothetical protein
VNTPLFDRAAIALPGGKSIQISADVSGPNHLKYIDGLKIDGQATDRTSLPESIIRTGGDLTFSLSAHPNKVWGTAESSAPPSFGAGSSAVTVNVSRPIVTIAPGSKATVKLDAQRMIDGAGGYTVTGTSSDSGITAVPASGQFAADGSAAVDVAITVAHSVPEQYYLVYLTTAVGESVRRSIVLVVAEAEAQE